MNELGTCKAKYGDCPHFKGDECLDWRPICGIAGNADISMNVDSLPTVTDASPSEELLLEWNILSKESREKVSKWFHLAERYLQQILDEEEMES